MSSVVYQREAAHAPFDEPGWNAVQRDITRCFTGMRQVTVDLAGFDSELKELTAAEIQQLQNIGTTTISGTQWGYLGSMDQDVSIGSNVSLGALTVTSFLSMKGHITMGGYSILNLLTTGSLQFDGDNHISQAVTGTIDYTAETLHNFVGPVTMDGALTVTGTTTLNGIVRLNRAPSPFIAFRTTGDAANGALIYFYRAAAQWGLFVSDDCGSQCLLGESAFSATDYDHGNQTNPTLFVHSATDPDSNNTQWWSITHDQTDALMSVGLGDMLLACPAQKTLELQTSVWDDINFGSGVAQLPSANIPDIVTFTDNAGGDTGIATRGFAVGEKLSYTTEILHKVKTAADLEFHVHFQCDAAPTGTDYVKWQLDYTITRDGVTCAAVTPIVIEVAVDTQYEQVRGDFPTVDGSSLLVGDNIKCVLTRIAAAGDAYVGDAKLVTFGIHVEIDTLGSRQEILK